VRHSQRWRSIRGVEGKLLVNVELKDVSPKGDLDWKGPVVESFRRHGMETKVLFFVVQSVHAAPMRPLAWDVPFWIALCAMTWRSICAGHGWLRSARHEARHPDFEMVDKRLVKWCHTRKVCASTCGQWTERWRDGPAHSTRSGWHFITNKPDAA